ncbi:MAG: accessory factor UbiK family protein [Micropepsaceae bacterium]
MQTENRVFDSLARAFTNAAGAAASFREEVETLVKGKLERLVADMDLVTREDFSAAKAMAAKARAENEKLEARIVELESKLGITKKPKPKQRAKKTKKIKATRVK